MNILCCLNTNYLNPLIVLLHSLRKHHKTGEVNLFLLSTNFSEKAQKTLQLHCKQLDINLWFKMHKLKNFSRKLNFTVDTYLRVFAFSLLPKNVDKVLYLDADMLLLDDVQKIYDIDVSNVKLAGCRISYVIVTA